MKIKLDENIGARGSERLAERAHDVSTVRDHFRRQPPRLFHRFLAALFDMRLTLIKDGERRLSRPRDLALLFTTVAEFL